MGLTDEKEIKQVWGSHIPLLKALLDFYPSGSYVECGCGNYSTPLLKEHSDSLITIEHDKIWMERVQVDFPPSHSHQYIYKKIRANNSTQIKELEEEAWLEILDFYTDCAERIKGCDMLFVDTFICCRVPALRFLASSAHLIVLHDTEVPGFEEVYEMSKVRYLFSRLKRYDFRPKGKVPSGCKIPWTSVFRKDEFFPFSLDSINETLRKESKLLWGVESELEFVK